MHNRALARAEYGGTGGAAANKAHGKLGRGANRHVCKASLPHLLRRVGQHQLNAIRGQLVNKVVCGGRRRGHGSASSSHRGKQRAVGGLGAAKRQRAYVQPVLAVG